MDGIYHLAETGTPFVWDSGLCAGYFEKDENGLWHLGEGTADLSEFIFAVSLTHSDRRLLKALNIGV